MGPDFMVIGAQRSGTTWLHRVLAQHPDLWLTPVKELHYFDKREIRFGVLDAAERRRARFWDAKRLLRHPRWYGRYWLLPRNDYWYGRLFRAGRSQGRRVGEITPAYAALGAEDWAHIQSLVPQLQSVFVMRDPVIRTWSALRNSMRKGHLGRSEPVEELLAQARKPSAAARSNYLRTIEIVEERFGADQLQCCFFEQLSSEPASLAESLFQFLGVPPLGDRLNLPPAINVAAGGDAPPLEFQRALAQDYLPMVERLAERFGAVPAAWAQRYRALLS
jgi:hypothetical protein